MNSPLVLVGNLDIVNVDVGAGHQVETVKATLVSSADDHVVDLAVRAGVQDDVESGRVNESNVVHAEVGDRNEAQETGSAKSWLELHERML